MDDVFPDVIRDSLPACIVNLVLPFTVGDCIKEDDATILMVIENHILVWKSQMLSACKRVGNRLFQR